ncbi:MAG: hypothetical protein GX684_03200 [Ruminococcaceae bacterium]|nr:hypothetical protein [Oscillospiraceae bacterium]
MQKKKNNLNSSAVFSYYRQARFAGQAYFAYYYAETFSHNLTRHGNCKE